MTLQISRNKEQQMLNIQESSGLSMKKAMKTVQRNTMKREEDQQVDKVKTMTSVKDIQTLQSGLLVEMEDMITITKIIDRIKARTLNNQHVFGIFLVLAESAPKYLRIELNNKIMKTLNIDPEDLIKTKNGLIILTESHGNLDSALEMAQEWSTTTNINIDKTQSVVMEFLPRRAKKQNLVVPDIFGIPVVKEYHFQGLSFDQKLTFQKQISLIKQKALEIAGILDSELKRSSVEARVEAWKEFVEPMFVSLLPGYVSDQAVTRKNQLETLTRVTFRRIVQLKKNYSSMEVEKLIGYSLEEKGQKVVEFYRQGWSTVKC